MPHTHEQMETIVRDAFRRISSDGKESVAPSFTTDAIYDFPYWPTYMRGNEHMAVLFSEILPHVLLSLKQWPIAIYPVVDGNTVIAEYASHATSAVDGSIYANRYTAVMKLVDGKIDFWREYFNVELWNKATGSLFGEMVAKMPKDSHRSALDDDSNVRRWKSQWTLPEFENPPI